MCGISGFLSHTGNGNSLSSVCTKMTHMLYHRGPDDGGIWSDDMAGIAMGHRRLSILDLSPSGHQPMHSISGRYVIVYNGEIYNFESIKKELIQFGCFFKGHSDTEVLIAAIDVWGVETVINKISGMFAFALWDKSERVLTLARDRLGEKPLYYGWQGKTFLFASELKALKMHPEWSAEIDRNSLSLFLRHSYIPSPYSIYKNIYKLLPGSIVHIPIDMAPGTMPESRQYWDAKEVVEYAVSHTIANDEIQTIEGLDRLLRETIRDKIISDVPLGAFLSGGIDSSTVVALMQAESEKPVKTFTIGFHEKGYNEAIHAKAIADHLGTEHTELYITASQAIDIIPSLPELFDEPFSDPSQIPTHLVAKMTRDHVTVALSGDGGDELFGGYSRYFLGQAIWNKVKPLPYPLRVALTKFIYALPPRLWDKVFSFINLLMPAKSRVSLAGDRIHKLASFSHASTPEDVYLNLVSHWKTPDEVVIDSREPLTVLTDKSRWAHVPEFVQHMQYLDMLSYLPDDILVKVDRAAMGVSLETRVPFLDHKVVEYAWSIPQDMKIRNGEGKWILRQVLKRYIPESLIDRPKMGFGVPIDNWLRGPLKDWADNLLNNDRINEEGYLRAGAITEKWHEHLQGRRNWSYYLWDVLMFQAWLDKQKDL
jgi:asparagine synthase (glutamine-hydrolysing)